MRDTLDAVLQAGVDTGAVPGAVAIVVDRDGVRYLGSAGERALGGGEAMTPDTVGAIFSMTKAITGAAAMQLVEQGRLDLDAPMSDVCPEAANPTVLEGFDDDGAPITRPAASEPTLRQLLTHTSGYVYEMWNADIGRWHEATGTPTIGSHRRVALQTPLMFDPGTRWEYGTGIDWAGLMVEAVSGLTLGEYLRQHLTGPLAMFDTDFVHSDDMAARAAAVHARLPDGGLLPLESGVGGGDDAEFESGGGGLHSTMSDYARFMRMILNGGELDGVRVLQPDTVDAMCTNQMGDLRVTELKTVVPFLTNDAELYPGEEKSWGLTFQVHEQDGATGRPKGALGWAGLANSYYWIDRTNGIAGAYLSQILPFADAGSIGVFYDLERAVYAAR